MSPSCPHIVPGGSVGIEDSVGSLIKAGTRLKTRTINVYHSVDVCMHHKCMHKLGGGNS